jgi:hypothetical protein
VRFIHQKRAGNTQSDRPHGNHAGSGRPAEQRFKPSP